MIVGRRTFWLRRRHSLVKRRGKLPGSSSITRWTWKAALYLRSRQILFAKVELYLHRYLTWYYNVICCLNTACYSERYVTLAARTRTMRLSEWWRKPRSAPSRDPCTRLWWCGARTLSHGCSVYCSLLWCEDRVASSSCRRTPASWLWRRSRSLLKSTGRIVVAFLARNPSRFLAFHSFLYSIRWN